MQRQTLLHILERRFHLAESELAALGQQFATIRDLTQLAQLVDQALDAGVVADFTNHLKLYVEQAD